MISVRKRSKCLVLRCNGSGIVISFEVFVVLLDFYDFR